MSQFLHQASLPITTVESQGSKIDQINANDLEISILRF